MPQPSSDASSEDLQLDILHALNISRTSLLMPEPVLTNSLSPHKMRRGWVLFVTRHSAYPGSLLIHWPTVSPLDLSHRLCKPMCFGLASVSPFALTCSSWGGGPTLDTDSEVWPFPITWGSKSKAVFISREFAQYKLLFVDSYFASKINLIGYFWMAKIFFWLSVVLQHLLRT